jgi:hypothetical protein
VDFSLTTLTIAANTGGNGALEPSS